MSRIAVGALFFCVSLFAVEGSAGTRLSYEIGGWSPNGKFLVFTRSGIEDGSGFAVCEGFVVDVDENDWVGRPSKIRVEDPEVKKPLWTACDRAWKKLHQRIRKLKIRQSLRGEKIALKSVPLTEPPSSKNVVIQSWAST